MYLPFRLSLYCAHCIFVVSQLQLCGWFCLFEGKWSESEPETYFMLGGIRPFVVTLRKQEATYFLLCIGIILVVLIKRSECFLHCNCNILE